MSLSNIVQQDAIRPRIESYAVECRPLRMRYRLLLHFVVGEWTRNKLVVRQ